MSSDLIPQCDPRAAVQERRCEIDAVIQSVLDSGRYILGPEVTAFEREFAAYIGVRDAVGVASGTDALELALRASGLEPGDLVATVSHTAVATVAAIERAGALPALVDIDPATCTMSPESLDNVLAEYGRSLKAVVPVHLYGQPADMDAILRRARAHGLRVVEDCSQAHGARWRECRVGALGDVAAFSFYPTKNLSALGDGGIVVTDQPEVADRVRRLREYGWRERYVSDVPGINSRLDELQAAVLRVKLRHLDDDNRRRRALAAVYDAELCGSRFAPPVVRPEAEHVYHQYVLRHARRDRLCRFLREQGIGTGVHYPKAVHQQPAYAGRLPQASDLTATERAAAEVVSLPMYPQLNAEAVARVVEALRAWPG